MDLFVDEKASSLKVLKLLYKHLLLIIIFSLVGFGVAVTFTFFIPKKYHSFAVVFPPNSNLGLNVLEDPRFGNNLDADQLMQLLESKQIKDTIIQMYDLETYYEVDKTDKAWKQKLDKKFFRDIKFSKTRYYSIVISATMTDPDLSANIVNSITEMVDMFRAQIMRQNQRIVFDYAKEQYMKQQNLVDSLKALIYAKKTTTDPNNILYNHILENSKSDFYRTNPLVDTPEMEKLLEDYNFAIIALTELKGDYHKAQRLIQKPFSKLFVVNKGVPSYKKTSPSFLVNGMAGLLSAFFFIVLFLIARSNWSAFIKSMKG